MKCERETVLMWGIWDLQLFISAQILCRRSRSHRIDLLLDRILKASGNRIREIDSESETLLIVVTLLNSCCPSLRPQWLFMFSTLVIHNRSKLFTRTNKKQMSNTSTICKINSILSDQLLLLI